MKEGIIRISVAMAAYNGERFLNEQLESIVAQSYQPAELVVSDDGSSDRTLEIVESFRSRAQFPIHLIESEGNLGFSDNFFRAVSRCQGDWIAFCDQDDLWLPNKLLDAVRSMQEYPDAVLILQNSFISDGDLKHDGRVFPSFIKPGHYPRRSQYGFWVWPGCLQTVSADMFGLRTSDRPRNYFAGYRDQSHDKWTTMIANALGDIVVLGEPVALYRRHRDALTGSYGKSGVLGRVGKAASVGAPYYLFLEEVADSHARYLREIAGETANESWRPLLRAHAEDFDSIATIQRERAVIYSAPLPARLRSLAKIIAAGGYVGPAASALGLKSLVKDLWAVFLRSPSRASSHHEMRS